MRRLVTGIAFLCLAAAPAGAFVKPVTRRVAGYVVYGQSVRRGARG